MKKLLAALSLFALFHAWPAWASGEETEYDNPGYYATHGMAGIYGTLPDYIHGDNKDGGIGGGGFIYYNVINKIGGNFSIGVSADYAGGEFNNGTFRAKMNMTPVALNFAYMTASDFLNFWAGLAVTYTFLDIDIKDGNVPDRINGGFGKLSRQSTGVVGGDAFVGAEYIFTENKKFGVFFEFRFSLTDSVKIDRYVPEQEYRIDDKMNFTKLRYTLGVSFHF